MKNGFVRDIRSMVTNISVELKSIRIDIDCSNKLDKTYVPLGKILKPSSLLGAVRGQND